MSKIWQWNLSLTRKIDQDLLKRPDELKMQIMLDNSVHLSLPLSVLKRMHTEVWLFFHPPYENCRALKRSSVHGILVFWLYFHWKHHHICCYQHLLTSTNQITLTTSFPCVFNPLVLLLLKELTSAPVIDGLQLDLLWVYRLEQKLGLHDSHKSVYKRVRSGRLHKHCWVLFAFLEDDILLLTKEAEI